MKRAALLLLAACAFAQAPGRFKDGDVLVEIGPGSALTVTVGPLQRKELVELIGTFFANGRPESKRRFDALLPQARTITLVLRSEVKP